MKKLVKLITAFGLSLSILAACGTGEDETTDEQGTADAGEVEETTEDDATTEELVSLVIGATNVPHAEVLEFVKPLLVEEGIDLEIVTFNDYVLPNEALDAGELDANYFQHIPYLEMQIEEQGYDFVNAGGIHIEPIGVYSQDYGSLDELPEGAQFILSDSVADHGRILMMLEDHGLITLAEGAGIGASLDDIVENPKNFEFLANVEAALLPTAYEHNEGDAILINSNYALDAGLNPVEDAIALESGDQDNPYVNVIAVRSGDENDERITTLLQVLRSEDVKNFILETYDGAVVPAE
ncbi:MetQ/NlpA family ABC transporter substrate-binding protein [Evansella cellulosilytica]|uniref:Lipoprotein n=1 Tax=Evansella cellulosilytica (strain ATCC 21833 / DSM 2522 / FERM P-1141 / JCM 9156 / N-4) TaxID=649639 RepID=E6TQQ6_EVAC2|nr:MetQ/NlpA family ABC transporter substrate-binding protein [Evansella cellulosilytica]ADU31681.1 NLPA lipoprotein [Evansella cellulosilytica DSM 2522]